MRRSSGSTRTRRGRGRRAGVFTAPISREARAAALHRPGRDRRAADRAAAPRAGGGPRAACRRSGGVRRRRHRARSARDAAELVEVDYRVLPAVVDGAGGARAGRAASCGTRRRATSPSASSAATGGGRRRRWRGPRMSSRSSWSTTGSSSRRSSRARRSARYDAGDRQLDLAADRAGRARHPRSSSPSSCSTCRPSASSSSAPDVGGGFGIKNFLYPEWVLVLWAARRLGRPVNWVAERGEDFVSARRRAATITREGAARARRRRAASSRSRSRRWPISAPISRPTGPGSSTNSPSTAMGGVYAIPAMFSGGARRLHQHRAGRRLSRRRQARGQLPDRAAGRAGGARGSGIDPVELRRRNSDHCVSLSERGSASLIDMRRFAANLDAAAARADSAGFADAAGGRRPRGRLRGLGVGCFLETARGAPERRRRNPLRRRRRGGAAARHAIERPGPRDQLSADRRRSAGLAA